MELTLLDANFSIIRTVDSFSSLIWVDKFWDVGTLDVVHPPEQLSYYSGAVYAQIEESDHTMVLEDYNIESNPEFGDRLIVKGRSLASILDRRIAWEPTIMDGLLQTEINKLLDDNMVSPTDSDRDVPNFDIALTLDPHILGLSVNTQFKKGETLLEIISGLCRSKEIGFWVYLDSNNDLKFRLYKGLDRSYEQVTRPYVVFSADFDNLRSADFVSTTRFLKTIVLVAGEQGVGNERVTTTVSAPGGSLTGLSRRETYIEPSIRKNVGGTLMSDEDYILQLQGRGIEDLAKKIYVEAFDGEVDTSMYSFGTDFYMGDIVQIVDQYGNQARSRVTEMVYSHDISGISMYPSFTTKGSAYLLNGESVKSGVPSVDAPTLA